MAWGLLEQAQTLMKERKEILEELRPTMTDDAHRYKLFLIEGDEGLVDLRAAEFSQAIAHYEEMSRLESKLTNIAIQRDRTFSQVGRARLVAGQFRNAVTPLEQALKLAPEMEVPNIILYELSLALAYLGCEEFSLSENHIARAEELVKESPHSYQLAYVKMALASKILMDGSADAKAQEILQLLQDARVIFEDLGVANIAVAKVGYQIALAVLAAKPSSDQAIRVREACKAFERKDRESIGRDISMSLEAGKLREALKHYIRLLSM